MFGRGRSWVGALALCAATSCDSGSEQAPTAAEDPARVEALRALTNQVFVPTYSGFQTATRGLLQGIEAWAEDPRELGEARLQFSFAMGVWQEAEVMQVGPAASPQRPGGLGLRDEIYSWPAVNPCRVDQVLVSQAYAEPGFPTGALVNVYGLDTLEYLLFHPEGGNACPMQVPINADGTWAALDDLDQRRADYAVVVARKLEADATALHAAWSPDGGNFAGRLRREVDGPYPTARAALDDVFAGILYVDLAVKDAKLAEPAGLGLDCAEAACPDLLESRWAGASADYVAANLTGLERVLETGFYPLLGDVPDLVTELREGVETSRSRVRALRPSLADSLAADPAQARSAHAAVAGVTDLLKSQLVTVLNLSLPQEGAADND